MFLRSSFAIEVRSVVETPYPASRDRNAYFAGMSESIVRNGNEEVWPVDPFHGEA